MEHTKIKNINLSKRRKKIFRRRLIFLISIILIIGGSIFFVFSKMNKDESYRDAYKKNISSRELEKMRQELDIKEVNYKWGSGLKKGNSPKRLIIHHSATDSPETPEDIHKFHLDNGWSGIGYHFYIREDGTIYKGRDENVIGAHAKNANYNTLGICIEGNFEKEGLNEAQKNSLVKLGTYLSLKYPIKDILPHREVVDTLCPGTLFPMDNIKSSIIEEIKNMWWLYSEN